MLKRGSVFIIHFSVASYPHVMIRTALAVGLAVCTAVGLAEDAGASLQVDEVLRIIHGLECSNDFISGMEDGDSRRQLEGSDEEDGVAPFIVGQRKKEPGGEEDFLIRNTKDNQVDIVSCPTPAKLQKALLRFEALPHLAVMGESNAGKSSLINSLLRKEHAKASSMAGKTTAVDMMQINERFVLTDLPGLPSRDHQVEQKWEETWRPLVMQYIEGAPTLRAMLYLHDIRWKVSPMVRDFVGNVSEHLPVVLVLTKDDQLLGEVHRHMGNEPQSPWIQLLKKAQRQGRQGPGPTNMADFDAEVKRREHELRIRRTENIRKALDFKGLHVHYSCDASNPAGRRARRSMLRSIEAMCVTAESRDQCNAYLEDMALKRAGGAGMSNLASDGEQGAAGGN